MRIKSRYCKLCMYIIITLFIFFTPTFSLANTEIELLDEVAVEKSKIINNYSIFSNRVLQASTQFDLRTKIDVRIKDQKSTQNCWAFASNTALETNLAITKGETNDFSERHMTYATAKTFTDGINPQGHNREVSRGGNASIAMGYFTGGRGPVLESDMPFSENEEKIALSEIQGKTVQKMVKDYIVFPSILKTKDSEGNIKYTNEAKTVQYTETEVETIRNNIKQHIMNYGAVTSMTVSGTAYNDYYNYNLEYPAFYCDNAELELNHQISIIGWDDEYPITNFNEGHRPSNPGAYLILNSYGTEGNYKTGCYYVSYEDAYIESGIIGIINADNIDYDKIYQHDPLGMSNGASIGDSQTIYGANIFSRSSDSAEQLNEISVATVLEQNVEVYVNSQDGELTQSKLQKVETEATTVRQGYTTLKLKNPIKLAGDKFVVVVKYTSINGKAYMGLESASASYWATATSSAGQSYYSLDMNNWTDLADQNNGIPNSNICIKAFTTEVNSDITSNSYKIEGDLIYKISPLTNVQDFKNKLQINDTIKILKNNIELSNSDIITTNATLVTSSNKTYTLIVTGDITGSGNVSITDVSKIKIHMVELELLNAMGQKAADVNYDNNISLTDLGQMKSAVVGLINL